MSGLPRGSHGSLRADAVAVLDTGTTGLFPDKGNRICTVGVVVLARRTPDGGEVHGALADAEIATQAFARLDVLGWFLPVPAHALPHRHALGPS